jgi:hypothetical protein
VEPQHSTEIEKLKNQSSYQTTWLKKYVNVLVITGFAAILGMTTAAPLVLLYTFQPSKLDNAIEKRSPFFTIKKSKSSQKLESPRKERTSSCQETFTAKL